MTVAGAVTKVVGAVTAADEVMIISTDEVEVLDVEVDSSVEVEVEVGVDEVEMMVSVLTWETRTVVVALESTNSASLTGSSSAWPILNWLEYWKNDGSESSSTMIP